MANTISNEDIMNLRNQTGAGIMDCKNALKEADGDISKAVEILRKKGLSGLAKRSGRAMKEGIIVLKNNNSNYVMVEVDCETDFVARNDEFKSVVNSFADEMLSRNDFNPAQDEASKEKLKNIAMKIGENMQIRRAVRYSLKPQTVIGSYLHSDLKKAAMVSLSYNPQISDISKIETLAKNLAMQAVAMGAKWIKKEDVPQEVIEKEKEIYKSTPQAQGKSEIAISKMLEGRIKKFYQEMCLIEQAYIRDTKLLVSDYIKSIEKETGVSINIERFDTFIVGVE
ncbi:MAG: translation elongation factor Ts [Elusimicrobiota bacterium]